jgi:hypothetical protein
MSEPIPDFPRSRGRQSAQKNEAIPDAEEPGGTGSVSHVDCDGNLIVKIEWKDGVTLTNGHFTVQSGCDGSSSGGSSS